jgi:hypothetical protein
MNPLVPFLLISKSAGHRKKLIKEILPATLPGSPTNRLMITALIANIEIQRQEETDEKIVKEVAKFNRVTSAEALKEKFPKLHELVYAKLPESVQNEIFRAPRADKPPK